MSSPNIYILDGLRYRHYSNLYGEVCCYKCGKELRVEEKVVSRIASSKRVLYCIECAKVLNII